MCTQEAIVLLQLHFFFSTDKIAIRYNGHLLCGAYTERNMNRCQFSVNISHRNGKIHTHQMKILYMFAFAVHSEPMLANTIQIDRQVSFYCGLV